MAKERKQAQFLEEYVSQGFDKVEARKALGIPRQTVSDWFNKDESFQAQFERMKDSLERQLYEKALDKALKDKGDSIMIIFLMKSLNPNRYDDGMRKQALANDAVKQVAHEASLKKMTPREVIAKLKAADPFVDYDTLLADDTETTEPQ